MMTVLTSRPTRRPATRVPQLMRDDGQRRHHTGTHESEDGEITEPSLHHHQREHWHEGGTRRPRVPSTIPVESLACSHVMQRMS